MLILPLLMAFVLSCSQPSIDIPGGTMDVSVLYWGDTVPDVIVAFDPDANVMSGNETLVRVSLDPYWDQDGDVSQFFTWSSEGSDLALGDYFVYAFIDLDSDGQYGQLEIYNSQIVLYDPNGRYTFNTQNMQIELPINSYAGRVLPNYSYTTYFAPQLHFSLNVNVG